MGRGKGIDRYRLSVSYPTTLAVPEDELGGKIGKAIQKPSFGFISGTDLNTLTFTFKRRPKDDITERVDRVLQKNVADSEEFEVSFSSIEDEA